MSEEKEIEEEYPYHHIAVYVLIAITIFLIFTRIVFYFYLVNPWLNFNRDIDFIVLREGMKNGLINFYDPIEMSEWPPYYLYYWYFVFYPIFLLPAEIGVYVWDGLRLISVAYVFIKVKAEFENRKDLYIFYIFCSIGFFIDGYFNNSNFLVLFFLFSSYRAFKKDKKWLAGIFFTLAVFKINAILFLPLLLITKKIKPKDLVYFLVPLFIICIPYVIFPEYFLQMVTNWTHSDESVDGILRFESIFWKALQPSHLMFLGMLLIIFLEGITDARKKNIYRIISLLTILLYYVYITTVVFIIPVLIGGEQLGF